MNMVKYIGLHKDLTDTQYIFPDTISRIIVDALRRGIKDAHWEW